MRMEYASQTVPKSHILSTLRTVPAFATTTQLIGVTQTLESSSTNVCFNRFRRNFVRCCTHNNPSDQIENEHNDLNSDRLMGSTSLESTQPQTKCGFVALIGPPNSGKSTLLNRLVGQKLAIVSPKVQTTRCRIAGITTFSDTQVIFLDTPGIFSPTTRLSRAMVKTAWKSSRNADVTALILDSVKVMRSHQRKSKPSSDILSDLEMVVQGVARARSEGRVGTMCVCVNKFDLIPKSQHDYAIDSVHQLLKRFDLEHESISLFQTSAQNGLNVRSFCEWVVKNIPSGPWLYPNDDLTDMPARLLAAEVTREKSFGALRQELPYDVAVETTSYKENVDGSIRITQDVIVARDSQKRIVTGRGGSVIKSIGVQSRQDLTEILGATVHLILTVKVRSHWKDDQQYYRQWGLDFNA